MGIPADADLPPPTAEPIACPRCDWAQTAVTCSAAGCGNRFFPQPGYSRMACPLHDPGLDNPQVPPDFRTYKLAKAQGCVKCGVASLARR